MTKKRKKQAPRAPKSVVHARPATPSREAGYLAQETPLDIGEQWNREAGIGDVVYSLDEAIAEQMELVIERLDESLEKLAPQVNTWENTLETSRELQRAGEDLVGMSVALARASGASWTEVGEELGITKQAAQQRFKAVLSDE